MGEGGKPLIRDIGEGDREWINRLLDANPHLTGAAGKIPLFRFLRDRPKGEFWVAIGVVAFAHFRVRRDGAVVLYEIAVDERVKRRGLGRALMGYLRRYGLGGIELKTDSEHEESNAFYLALGMKCYEESRAKYGKLVKKYVG
jgi:ribosomal protein S18 acetylase RimI-like enzyme